MIGGYIGKILSVDLSSGKLSEASLDKNIARKFLGGKVLALS